VVRVVHSIGAGAAVAHSDDRSTMLCSHTALATNAENNQQQDDYYHRQSEAENQAKDQPQRWAVVDVAHVTQLLNKAP